MGVNLLKIRRHYKSTIRTMSTIIAINAIDKQELSKPRLATPLHAYVLVTFTKTLFRYLPTYSITH